jgi:hypothetical protein
MSALLTLVPRVAADKSWRKLLDVASRAEGAVRRAFLRAAELARHALGGPGLARSLAEWEESQHPRVEDGENAGQCIGAWGVRHSEMRAAGDLPGHEFHGNQWTGGGAGGDVLGHDITVSQTESLRGIPALTFRLPGEGGYLKVETATPGGRRLETSLGNDWAYITSMEVAQKGTGFTLLKEVHGYLKKKGFAGIASQHDSRSPDANRFWKSIISHGADVEDTGREYKLKALLGVGVEDLGTLRTAGHFADKSWPRLRHAADRLESELSAGKSETVAEDAVRVFAATFAREVEPVLVGVALKGAQLAAKSVLRIAGDLPGHEFHGNQWTTGVGNVSTFFPPEPSSRGQFDFPEKVIASPLERYSNREEALAALNGVAAYAGDTKGWPTQEQWKEGVVHPFPHSLRVGASRDRKVPLETRDVPVRLLVAGLQGKVFPGGIKAKLEGKASKATIKVVLKANGRYEIVDGYHRATAAYMSGADTIRAVVATGIGVKK